VVSAAEAEMDQSVEGPPLMLVKVKPEAQAVK